MDTSADREKLKSLLKKHSVHHGEFTLASGEKSNVYVDCRLTTLRAEAMPLIGRLLLERSAERGWRPTAVGGLTMGADPVATAVARESLDSGGSPVNAYLIRKEAKGHGRGRFLEGLEEPKGHEAIVVDDVCTSGGSTLQAIERSREAGIIVLGALCVVDREAGGREAIEALGVSFERLFTMDELLEQK